MGRLDSCYEGDDNQTLVEAFLKDIESGCLGIEFSELSFVGLQMILHPEVLWSCLLGHPVIDTQGIDEVEDSNELTTNFADFVFVVSGGGGIREEKLSLLVSEGVERIVHQLADEGGVREELE